MLANDLRPYNLNNVIGQKTVVTGIKNFFKNKQVPNVIAFVGASGCGKNTIGNIFSMTLNCHKPITEGDGSISPCCECPSCKDVIAERFQRDIHVFSGNEVTAEKIQQIQEIILYNSNDNNCIIQINEAQLVPNLRRLLEIVETPRKNVYWVLTSTDTEKFSNTYGKSNKNQEKNAFRSRLTLMKINPISTDSIGEYLFELLSKIDPEEKIPEVFIEEGLQLITTESKQNLRQAINDFNTCISSEAYTNEEVRNLLGYEDESKEYDQIYYMATKNPLAMKYIQESNEIEGNFRYWNKILSDIVLRDITNIPCNEPWKEQSAKQIIATGNLQSLFEVFTKTHEQSSGYFNTNIFISNLYSFYRGDSKPKNRLVENNTNVPVKKIKVIKGE